MSIQIQTVNKDKVGPIKIQFREAYETPPTVFVQPNWQGQIGSMPTITAISKTGCTITDQNKGTTDQPYVLNILSLTDEDSFGKLASVTGNVNKTTDEVKVNFNGNHMPPDPFVLLSPFWKGSNNPVGNIDTLDDNGPGEISIQSTNKGPQYFVNYLIMAKGITSINVQSVTLPPIVISGPGDKEQPSQLPPIPMNFQNGVVNKTNVGRLRVYFRKPFSTPPTIFLSPWWDDQNSSVGSVLTVTNVQKNFFDFVGENKATNYFVNWMAIGK